MKNPNIRDEASLRMDILSANTMVDITSVYYQTFTTSPPSAKDHAIFDAHVQNAEKPLLAEPYTSAERVVKLRDIMLSVLEPTTASTRTKRAKIHNPSVDVQQIS